MFLRSVHIPVSLFAFAIMAVSSSACSKKDACVDNLVSQDPKGNEAKAAFAAGCAAVSSKAQACLASAKGSKAIDDCVSQSPDKEQFLLAILAASMPSSSSSAAPSAPAAAAPSAKSGGDPTAIVATCQQNAGIGGGCTEYVGDIPAMAEDLCKRGDTGKFARGATQCSRTGLVGSCTTKHPDGTSETSYTYKQPDQPAAAVSQNGKTLCDIVSGQWTDVAPAPGSAAPSSAAKPAPIAAKPHGKKH